MSVATEARFQSERDLHDAVAEHPEVLPAEDLGLGPLVTLAKELDFGHGPLDLLAADSTGRLVIVEFKKGTENVDVRKVVAQVLDYGAALWRASYDDLELRCGECDPGFEGPMAQALADRFATVGVSQFDPAAFRSGVEGCLRAGNFVFVYCGRDLDTRTKRIMTYLAEGVRMTFFAVEVDYFRSAVDSFVLVPRTAFVPSWITDADRSDSFDDLLTKAPSEVKTLIASMDALARDMGLVSSTARASRTYRPAPNKDGVAVDPALQAAQFGLRSFRRRGQDDIADTFLEEDEQARGQYDPCEDVSAGQVRRSRPRLAASTEGTDRAVLRCKEAAL